MEHNLSCVRCSIGVLLIYSTCSDLYNNFVKNSKLYKKKIRLDLESLEWPIRDGS